MRDAGCVIGNVVGHAGRLAPACAIAAGLLLSGCDDGGQIAPATGSTAPVAAAQPQAAAPAPIAASAQPAGQSDSADAAATGIGFGNDPSAPSNTPLCGIAAQERNALDRALLSRQYADAGQCSAYACYDAATATYIGADGYHHVCR